jgi:hypothetical protein
VVGSRENLKNENPLEDYNTSLTTKYLLGPQSIWTLIMSNSFAAIIVPRSGVGNDTKEGNNKPLLSCNDLSSCQAGEWRKNGEKSISYTEL